MNTKYILIIILVVIAIITGWYFIKFPQTPEQITGVSFLEEGNVIKDNPGLDPGTWYLSYEKPGSSGLLVKLDLNSTPAPYIDLTQGERVKVSGILKENIVVVDLITPISTTTETGMTIKLYFYNPNLDQGPGGTQCTKKGLVEVTRVIPKTTTPL